MSFRSLTQRVPLRPLLPYSPSSLDAEGLPLAWLHLQPPFVPPASGEYPSRLFLTDPHVTSSVPGPLGTRRKALRFLLEAAAALLSSPLLQKEAREP